MPGQPTQNAGGFGFGAPAGELVHYNFVVSILKNFHFHYDLGVFVP